MNSARLSANIKRKRRLIVLVVTLVFALFLLDHYVLFAVTSIDYYKISNQQPGVLHEGHTPLNSMKGTQSPENGEKLETISTTVSLEKANDIEYRIQKNKYSRRNVFVKINDIKKKSTNIFFVETRCSPEKQLRKYKHNKGFLLNGRQCCAIESTALANLDRDIYIFHSCPVSNDFFKYSPKFVEKLFSYPNVHVVRINNSEIFQDTPVQELYEKRLIDKSNYPIEHASDIFRFLLIWRFGGVYCDLDIVTVRSFAALKDNWAGKQDEGTIACGVVNLEPFGSGHQIAQEALERLNKQFDGINWSNNGPLLLTSVILKQCNTTTVTEAVKDCRGNFTVLESHIHYPVHYSNWGALFRDDDKEGTFVKELKCHSFTVHIWNKLSQKSVVRVGSRQTYALLADEFCPEVYHNCGDTF